MLNSVTCGFMSNHQRKRILYMSLKMHYSLISLLSPIRISSCQHALALAYGREENVQAAKCHSCRQLFLY